MLKHNLLIESGSIGTDMVRNRLVYRLVDKDASRLPEIVRLTITLFECPCPLVILPPPTLSYAEKRSSLSFTVFFFFGFFFVFLFSVVGA